jgi:hypothetical protein
MEATMNGIPDTNIPHMRLALSAAMLTVQTKIIIKYGTPAVTCELRDICAKARDLNAVLEHKTLPALDSAAAAFAACIERLDDPHRPAPCGDERAEFQTCAANTMREFSEAFAHKRNAE